MESHKKFFYWPYIDFLRFLAVFVVMIVHFFDKVNLNVPGVRYGIYGVDLFFVISGFLITYILLDQRSRNIKPSLIYKGFYIKRFLRLFPLYYTLLIISFFIERNHNLNFNFTPYSLWYFLYTSNFLYVFLHQNSRHYLDPTWSLAVEEQFYIFWPLIVIGVKQVKTVYLITAFLILLAFISTSLFMHYGFAGRYRFLPISNLNTLGTGALLAYFFYFKPDDIHKLFFKRIELIVVTSFIGFIFFEWRVAHVNNLFTELSKEFFLIIFASSLLLFSIWNFKDHKIIKWVASQKRLLYLGKISYGLYLLHYPVLSLMDYALISSKSRLSFFIQEHYAIYFLLFATVTVIIAHLSWNYLEKFFLKFKAKFNY